MKTIKNAILQVMIIVSFTAPLCVWSAIYDGPTDDAAFTRLLQEVNDKSDLLDQKVDEAIAAGVSVDYAQVSQTTIRLFRDVFAPWDRNNPAVVQQMYDAVYFGRFDPVGPERLPFDELQDCIDVADAAIRELQSQIDGEITLVSPPDFSKTQIKLDKTHYQLGGQKVFASKFFWQPNEEDIMEAYGRSGEGYISVQHMETETKIKNWSKSSLRNSISAQTAQNRAPIQFFLGHIVPQTFWLREDYPTAFDGSRIFTDYDIDNPNTREWLSFLFDEQLASAVAPLGDNERVHMIANEPMFSIREGGVESSRGVSDFTMEKYQDWLEQKYDSIADLNTVYETNFNNFAEVKATYTTPLSLNYQGGPVWYDWNKFNLDRGNDWFQFLHDGVHKADPLAMTHVKVMGERSVHTPYQDEGLDFEFITNLVDMPGSDAQMSSFAADWDLRHVDGWRERYSLEWRAQSIMLDFMKSLTPEKHMYDSEWHNLSGSRWRDFHMAPEYVRATFYLGITHGLGSVTTWVWNRKADGAIDTRADFIGTSVTQPIQLDAYGRAWKEINAHGDLTLSLTPQERDYIVYYNKDAAIQDSEYTFNMSELYEALKLQNVAVGFATPSTLGQLNPASQTLFVSPTRFISDEDLAALQAFTQNGGNLVLVEDDANFERNELGQIRTTSKQLGTFATIKLDSVLTMLAEMQPKLKSLKPLQDVEIKAVNGQQEEVFGVLLNQLKEGEKEIVVSLINTSQQTVKVNLFSALGFVDKIENVITDNSMNNNIEMPPLDVKLLRLSIVETEPTISVQSIEISGLTSQIVIGQTIQLTATVFPVEATDKEVVWSTDNNAVATVSESGLVTAVGIGDVTIKAVATDWTSSLLTESNVVVTVTEDLDEQEEDNTSTGGSLSFTLFMLLTILLMSRQAQKKLR